MDSLDSILNDYIQRFLDDNRAGRDIADRLQECGTGFMPLVDHCTLRTHDVDRRAEQFLKLGYQYDEGIGVLEFENWWAKVFRKSGYPTLFIDQAYEGERGAKSLIPAWVDNHGDQCFHHIAILVEDIESAIAIFNQRGFEMAGDIVGSRSSDLRQIFTQPELKNGQVYSVLELIERHNGYPGFLPPQADGLMESTRRD